jgi:hypothetical protein
MAQVHDPSKPPPDHWDEEMAAGLVGKLVLVGLSHVAKDDTLLRREQFYGCVVSADRSDGIVLELEGGRAGETYALPPQTSALSRARPGEYRLSSTGETVVDPDFTAAWTVTPPDDA